MRCSVQTNSTYCLINVKSGTCLDLSCGDNVSIIGWGVHQGPNQKWIFESAGHDKMYYIKSTKRGQYLSAIGEPRKGQKLVASWSPYAWRMENEDGVDGAVRLFSESNVNYCIDLAGQGDPKWGTHVQLWSRSDVPNQVWRLHSV